MQADDGRNEDADAGASMVVVMFGIRDFVSNSVARLGQSSPMLKLGLEVSDHNKREAANSLLGGVCI